MVTRISKLKNFGIFNDFIWDTDLPEFKKFNLIYGWNRSGKTTLSRVFRACEKSDLNDANCPVDGELEIETNYAIEQAKKFNNENISSCFLPIRVFNQDFIDDNISFNPEDSCNPIVYVSKEDIDTKKKITELRELIPLLSQKYNESKKQKDSAIRIEDSFRISIAQTITQTLTDKKNRDRYYSYDKGKVKEKINEIGIDNIVGKKLSNEDKNKYETISKSEAKNEQSVLLELSNISFDDLFTKVNTLLNKEVISELLQRLKNPNDIDGGLDEELNSWVKKGFEIHKTKNQFKQCFFCENNLNENFFNSLAKHFSDDYENLQSSIILFKEDLKKEKLQNIPESNMELYTDLRNDYELNVKKYNEIVNNNNNWLEQSEMWLEKKYNNPFDKDLSCIIEKPENYRNLLNIVIEDINKIILDHNKRVKNYIIEVRDAKEKLELHFISSALLEQDYKKMEDEIKDFQNKEADALAAVNKNNLEILELEKKNSNIGEAIDKINIHLKDFFGKEEIKLELDSENKGYIINRNGDLARNLSEGEKTAIAFSYFIVKIKEGEFKIENGIIFIDDPISSFDSNFIYHAFSLIKNNFNQIGQLFVSTHNFQFFNLTKDWFSRKNKNIEQENKDLKLKRQKEKDIPCGFYMTKSYFDSEAEKRSAKIIELDRTLRDNKSEYSFLFSLLKSFNEKMDEITFEEIYNISNIGRRFFDIFVDFKIPDDKKEQKDKLDMIVKEINNNNDQKDQISSTSCDKMLWLLNGFSHDSDPTSTIEHKDKSESQDAIRILLDIIKKSDKKHYEILEKNLI